MGFWDIFYVFGLPIALAAMVFSLVASFWTKSTFKKYSKVMSSGKMTGYDVAQRILHENRLSGKFGADYTVDIQHVSGSLTDHYSPKEKVLRLSDSVYNSTSVAAIGVAAHECGHAIQDSEHFMPNMLRSALAPLAGIGSQAGPYLAIIGFVFSGRTANSSIGSLMINAGILLYAVAVLFYLVTLPVELDASRRAVKILDESRILSGEELSGAKKVLSAAAMTYVAAAAAAIITLLRLMALSRRRN